MGRVVYGQERSGQTTNTLNISKPAIGSASWEPSAERLAQARALYAGATNRFLSFEPRTPNTAVEWKNEVRRLAEVRSQFIGDLLKRLPNERDPVKKSAIIYLLGEYRASETSAQLVNMIGFEGAKASNESEQKRLPLWGEFPAYEALVKIGSPTAREVIKKLETTTDSTARNLGASVIRAIYGREIGVVVLAKARDNQTNEIKTANLNIAIEIVRTGREP
jgi:hypothetical protein